MRREQAEEAAPQSARGDIPAMDESTAGPRQAVPSPDGRTDSGKDRGGGHTADTILAETVVSMLLPSISARILRASPEELDEVIRDCLRQVLETLHLDRGGLFKVQQDYTRVVVSHAWYSPGAELLLERVNLAKQTAIPILSPSEPS